MGDSAFQGAQQECGKKLLLAFSSLTVTIKFAVAPGGGSQVATFRQINYKSAGRLVGAACF